MALSVVSDDAGVSGIVPHRLPEFSAATRLLLVAPHPDDESLAAGVVIQQVLAAGGSVRIVLLTAGDNNPWPQRWLERRLLIGPADRFRWGQRRLLELKDAMRCLGVAEDALQFMGWPDMGITTVLMDEGPGAVDALAHCLTSFAPTVVIAPSIQDSHPDHGAAHVLMRLALARQPSHPEMFTYLIHGNAPSAKSVEVRGAGDHLRQKMAALAAHRTQMALGRRRLQRVGAAPERFLLPADDQRRRVWLAHPPRWLRSSLRVYLATPNAVASWRWADAPLVGDDAAGLALEPSHRQGSGPHFMKLACVLPSPWIFDRWGWCEV